MEITRKLRRYLRHGMMPQLVAFEAVYRLRSVTRASQALHMAQPTVSGHLRRLSEAVGAGLFRCDGRHMLPTAAAQALHLAAQEVFGALERLEGSLAGMREAPPQDPLHGSDQPSNPASRPSVAASGLPLPLRP